VSKLMKVIRATINGAVDMNSNPQPRNRPRLTVEPLEDRIVLDATPAPTFRIVEAQLQILGGLGGHNLLVVLDQNNKVVHELDGLATDSSGHPVTMGVLPWSTHLQGWDEVALAKEFGESVTYYKQSEPQATLFTGTQAQVDNLWGAALACMAKFNQAPPYYPPFGMGDNSDSFENTERVCMNLDRQPLSTSGALLVPFSNEVLLPGATINAIQQQHNIPTTTTDPSDQINGQTLQKNSDGSDALTTQFADGSRVVDTDASGQLQEVQYAASGFITSDATESADRSSLVIDQHVDPASDATLTATYTLDAQGQPTGDPALSYTSQGHQFSAQEMFATLGSDYAKLLVGGNGLTAQFAGAAGSTLFSTAFGAVRDLSKSLLNPSSGGATSLDNLLSNSVKNLTFSSVVQSIGPQAASAVTSLALATMAQKLGLNGFESNLLTKTGLTLEQQIYKNIPLAQSTGDWSHLTDGINLASVSSAIATAGGALLGQELANSLIDAKSVGQGIFASIAGTEGTLQGVAAATALGPAVASLVGAEAGTLASDILLDVVLPGVGAVVGEVLGSVAGSEIYNFLNDITGGLFGRLFGGGQPWDYQYFGLDSAHDQLTAPASSNFTKHTNADLRSAVDSISQAVCDGVNGVLATLGGTPVLTPGAGSLDVIAWVNSSKSWGRNDFQDMIGGNSSNSIYAAGDPAKLVRKAVEDDLRLLTITGGNPVLVAAFEAWKKTPAPAQGDSLALLESYLATALEYKKYLKNPAAINALMADAPDSAFTTGWLATLAQAEALGLNNVPAFTSAPSATFRAGVGGTFTVTASGAPTPALAETATMPSGVTFAPATGALTVSPSAAVGTYSLVFTASDGTDAPVVQNFSLIISSPPAPTLSVKPDAPAVALAASAAVLRDTAVLGGGVQPGGSLTFTLSEPSGKLVDTETVAVKGDGTYTTPNGYTLPSAGTVTGAYLWSVNYSGDANNVPVSDNNDKAEQVAVSPANPTLTATGSTTNLTLGATTVVLGSGARLMASAPLTGGYFETGSLTFTLYDPSGKVVDTETVAVKGNRIYTTTNGYTPTAAGTYEWVASYTGDGNNNSASTQKGDAAVTAVGAGATVAGSSLYLVGGNAFNWVSLAPFGTSTTGATGIQVDATLNGKNINHTTYKQAFNAVYIVTFDGNDNVYVAGALSVPIVVVGGVGNDNVQLGAGANEVMVGAGNHNIRAGNGNNTVVVGAGIDNITLGDGNNVINAPGSGTHNIWASNGNNTITVGGNNNITLGNGHNMITAGDGNDNVQLGAGANKVMLGTGIHNLRAGNGNNTVLAGDGIDNIYLGDGNNVVVGGNGHNNIQVGNGANLLVGGSGESHIRAGNGSNILVDGTVSASAALDQVLGDWILFGHTPANVASIRGRLHASDNPKSHSTIAVGTGFDWFWEQNALTNRKGDLVN